MAADILGILLKARWVENKFSLGKVGCVYVVHRPLLCIITFLLVFLVYCTQHVPCWLTQGHGSNVKGENCMPSCMSPMIPRTERKCGVEEKRLKWVDLESSLWKILSVTRPVKLWSKGSCLMVDTSKQKCPPILNRLNNATVIIVNNCSTLFPLYFIFFLMAITEVEFTRILQQDSNLKPDWKQKIYLCIKSYFLLIAIYWITSITICEAEINTS